MRGGPSRVTGTQLCDGGPSHAICSGHTCRQDPQPPGLQCHRKVEVFGIHPVVGFNTCACAGLHRGCLQCWVIGSGCGRISSNVGSTLFRAQALGCAHALAALDRKIGNGKVPNLELPVHTLLAHPARLARAVGRPCTRGCNPSPGGC